jgi:serine/threonine-protein kinase
MSDELNVCAFCGQRLDSTLVREQYGGACPRCLGGAFALDETQDEAPTLPPPTGGRFGKFVLTDRLGKGGMGEVWKAQDNELRRTVALKFLHSEDPVELARFKREAHMAAGLSHPNIGAIHEIGQVDGRHYLAMQYVPGRTLEKYPKEDRRMMAQLIRDAARAVEHAHRNGVLHRDIKPGNLMVEETDDGTRVVVLDFGIARSIEGGERFSMSGDVIGTPAYMSPEQARGAELDERADVYSLGATLYEVLTGRVLFDGANVYDILKQVEEVEPAAPRRLDPRIPHDLETIVLKCLEKEPVRRYDSAKELADDLDRFLTGEAILAKRANTIYRFKMKLAKRKGIVGTSSIAAVLLGSVLAWWIFSGGPRAEHLRRMEEGRRLWEEARLAAIGGSDPAEIRKKSRAAREQFEAAIEARSESAAHLMRGRCLGLEGDEKAAQVALETALELDPGNAEARVALAKSLLLTYVAWRGEPLTATYSGWASQHVAALVAERPEERQVRERAEGLLKHGETAPAQRGLLNGLLAMGKGDFKRAAHELAVYTKAERWDAQALMLEGMCGYLEKNFDSAFAAFDRSLILVPRAEGFRWRGLTKQAKTQYDEAIADYTKAVDLDPKHARAIMNRGTAKQARGRVDDAILDYTHALELDPKLLQAWINRGNGRYGKGQVDDAIKDYDKAIELNPAYMVAYYNRGTLKQAKGLHDDAIADFTKVIDLDPKLAGAYLNRGVSKYSTGRLDEAIDDFSKAIEKDEKYARAYDNRGSAKQAKGLFEEAVADWQKALEVAPPEWPLRAVVQDRVTGAAVSRLYLEASRLYERKRYSEAIEKFAKLVEGHPKSRQAAPSAYNLACCHALQGEKTKALEWIEKAVKLGYTDAAHLEKDSDLESLRGESEFRRILDKLKSRQES